MIQYTGGRQPTLSEIEATVIRRKSSIGLAKSEIKTVDATNRHGKEAEKQ